MLFFYWKGTGDKMEWSIYVVSLAKYNNGLSTGDWFNLPVTMETIRERLNMGENEEEIAIYDYELPFEISEYESIYKLNRMYKAYQDNIAGTELEDALGELLDIYGSMEEVIESKDEIIIHTGVSDVEGLLYQEVQNGFWGEVSDSLIKYIDFSDMARDEELEREFIITSGAILEVLL